MRVGFATVLLAAMVVGCDDDPAGLTVHPGTPGGAELTADFLWTASGDYSLELVQPVPDLDGDGLSDAVVRACVLESHCEPLVVHSPLQRDLVLPGDEDGSLPTWIGGVAFSGDLTGDGLADLVMVGGDDYQVFVGPILGTTDPTDELWGQVFDVNEDGVLDLATFGDPRTQISAPVLEIRYGPRSRWDGDADVVLDPGCDLGLSLSDWSFSPAYLWPDFTGDGAQELSFPAYTYADTCQGWFLTPPGPGVYDPEVDLDGLSIPGLTGVFPDQNGDGIAEITFSEPRGPWEMVAGPVSVLDGVAAGGERIATIESPVYLFHPIEFDLNGDGIGEFLVGDGVTTQLVDGGADGLSALDDAPTWPGGATAAWLEEGRVFMAATSGGDVSVVDLGEGVAVDNWPE